jgi:predicted metal-binding membrane protein
MRALQPSAFGECDGRFAGTLRAIGRRPTLWVELGVVATWVALALTSGEPRTDAHASGGPLWSSDSLWVCIPGMADTHPHAGGVGASGLSMSSLTAGLPMWALMAAAMMLTTAMPAIRHVAVNSLYWRRRRAVLEFLTVFLGVWVIFSAVVLGLLASWKPASSATVLAGVLALATLWQLTPLKRRALRACHHPRVLPPHGWRATVGVAHFGLSNGGACLASCWAMMLTMAVVSSPMLLWMALFTGLITAEKLNLKPGRTARRVGGLLGSGAICAAAFTALG